VTSLVPRVAVVAVVAVLGTGVALAGDWHGAPEHQAATRTGSSVSTGQGQSRDASPLSRLDARMDRLGRPLRRLSATAGRLERWYGCVHTVPVSQAGDPHHGWGFVYDEMDGTGTDLRTALVPHTGSGRPDLLMLRLSRRLECLSAAPDPHGTGRAAGLELAGPRRGPDDGSGLRKLGNRMQRIESRIDGLEDAFDRFDEWESCLSWLPVTEYGDELQNLGFHFDDGRPPAPEQSLRIPALDIDGSEWDDPDYMFLAFVGRDRPFSRRECEGEPGESVDRVGWYVDLRGRLTQKPGKRGRFEDLRGDLRAAVEDVEDLVEPAQEFVQFDECMFTVGVQVRSGGGEGYEFRTAAGTLTHVHALSYDLSDGELPQLDLMAFPGEEAPQIECNEDASGVGTDE
jgi:hypothetical protein